MDGAFPGRPHLVLTYVFDAQPDLAATVSEKRGKVADLRDARRARERGDILRTLKEEYARSMTSVANLLAALDGQGIALFQEELDFHLSYLAEQAYVQIWRTRDLPGFRSDRPGAWKPDAIRFAKLLPKGLQLLDGKCAEDPLVRF